MQLIRRLRRIIRSKASHTRFSFSSSFRISSNSSSSWDSSDFCHSDSDDERSSSSTMPDDVPKGFLVVYAGKEEKQRFVVDAQHLNHPCFKVLLQRSAEEYGFEHMGGLIIPCEVLLFEHLLGMLNHGVDQQQLLEMEELIKLLANAASVI